VDRWLLNTFPTWELVIMHVGGAILIGVGGFFLARKFVPTLSGHAADRSLSSAFGLATGLFSFVLAFTIGQLYANFTRAGANAKTEATAIGQVLRSSQGLQPGLRLKIQAEALDYASEVRTHEWKLMQHGGASVRAWQEIDSMYDSLEDARTTDSSNPFYGQTLARVNDLVVARRARLDDANIALPSFFQVLLLVGAVIALSTTFYFKPFGEGIQVFMIGAASAMVGLAMLVALMLDYPYSGSIAVSSAPFREATLILLAGI
jgi:Protein of unknown function (DUF4239)